MKSLKSISSKALLTAMVLIFALSLISCQPAVDAPTPSGSQAAVQPAGDGNLPDPAVGLNGLTAYRQTLTVSTKGTLDGKPYESVQTLERTSNAGNELLKINETTGGNAPVVLQYARLDGYAYSFENAACRMAPLEDGSNALTNPAERLLAVSGASETGSEEINGIPSAHYTFDEKAVARKSGKNDRAQGEYWLAKEGGYLVKYTLTAAIVQENFAGTRSWAYELTPANGKDVFQLPDSCLPALTGLPALQDAAEMTLQPGFLQYLSGVSRTEAVEFYNEALSAQGWQVLPGSKPEEMDLAAEIQTMAFSRETSAGGTLLVIRLDETDGKLRVTAQALATKQVVQANFENTAVTAGTEAPASTDVPASLPGDLPAYPGAEVVTQSDAFTLLQTADPVLEAASFYKDEMPGSGWTLESEMNPSGMIIQSWVKGEARLVITFSENQGKTQIMISAE